MFAHDHPFDPTYGYDLDALLAIEPPAEPDDFAAFWRSTYKAALAMPLNVASREIEGRDPKVRLFEVAFDALGRQRIGGWLTVPRDGAVRRGMVIGHGYGGREAPPDRALLPDAAILYPCARGFHRSADPAIPNNAAGHVVHGIAHRDTYVHRGCVADIWAAVSALRELQPDVGDTIFYHGASFGGGIGALAVPWDKRIIRASLEVPSFGQHPLRLTMPCVGSGESVRNHHRDHPEVTGVLQYFDAALAAKHISVPIHCCCALFDPAVPPPGQFAVYNAIPREKQLYVRQAGHFAYDDQARDDAAVEAERVAFFNEG